jgi:hypothetical protein
MKSGVPLLIYRIRRLVKNQWTLLCNPSERSFENAG